MDRARQIQQSYDRLAAPFLERHRDRSVLHAWMHRFVEHVPTGVVLDLGAGPCADSAELRGLGLRVVSVDRSRHMLNVAREQFPGPRVQADLRQLPFQDESIAGVWASASLLHLGREELRPALAGIADILVRTGVLFISLKEGSGERWETSSYGMVAPRWFTYWSGHDVDEALAATGFELVESQTQVGSKDTWLVRIARAL